MTSPETKTHIDLGSAPTLKGPVVIGNIQLPTSQTSQLAFNDRMVRRWDEEEHSGEVRIPGMATPFVNLLEFDRFQEVEVGEKSYASQLNVGDLGKI